MKVHEMQCRWATSHPCLPCVFIVSLSLFGVPYPVLYSLSHTPLPFPSISLSLCLGVVLYQAFPLLASGPCCGFYLFWRAMGRFDISMCLVPRAPGSGLEFLPEDQFRVALGSLASRVDRTVSHATPRRIATAIVENVRATPHFAHQVGILVGNEGTREIIGAVLSDLATPYSGDGQDAVPLQCMIFSTEETSVVCEVIGNEAMGSVEEVVSGMRQVVLVALRYNHRTVTLVVVEQLSTTLIASMMGSVWCNIWLAIGGQQTIERSVAVLLEALTVRDAAKSFCCCLDSIETKEGDVEAMLEARASSDVEAQQLLELQRLICTSQKKGSECQRLADEKVELQKYLTEREEYFTRELEKRDQEVERLKHVTQIYEESVLKLSQAEVRITDLEMQLSRKEEELCAYRESAATSRPEAERVKHQEQQRIKQQQQERENENDVVAVVTAVCQQDAAAGGMCGAVNTHEHRYDVETLRQEQFSMQAALRDMQRRWSELNEENLQNVLEFQQKEKMWQSELKCEEDARIAAEEESLQLRDVIVSQGSSMDVVRETIQSSQLLQEQELDDLLLKIRAISSANVSACHRRVSPHPSQTHRSRKSTRMLSPKPVVKTRLPT